jgi:5,10-methylenetetrahydromethanopterin reductase
MKVGVFFDGFSSSAEMIEVARAAEAAGADSLWFAQHMGYREAFVWAAAAAAVTTRIRIVPTAITPYLWPPLPVAMSMATLAELAGDRVALAVSVGNLLNLAESGIEATRPVTAMREYVQALRSLWTGESVTAEGEVNQLRGARMAFDPAATLPLYVASTGPKVLQLAGAVGDGVLLSAGLTLASCKVCLAHAEAGASAAGRAPGAVRKASFINFSVSADGVTARAAMLRKLAFLFRSKGHAENIRSSGLPIDHAAIIAALARRDLEGAAGLLPDEAAQAFAVAGTPAECRERLADYLSIGLDEPIIEISGSAEERALALEVVRELA